MTLIDLNQPPSLSTSPACEAINAAIERSEPSEENTRQYLGASSIGHECARHIQYAWMCTSSFSSQTRDIFRRGHLAEELTREHLRQAGFVFAPDDELYFETANGRFRGHADGKIIAGPDIPGVVYPAIWEHKCIGQKGFDTLNRDGLAKAYPLYAAQVTIYQAYLDVQNPAILTAVNANSMARIHALVPFDAEAAQRWSDRAVMIIKATESGELLPRVTDNPDDWRCKAHCGFKDRCWG